MQTLLKYEVIPAGWWIRGASIVTDSSFSFLPLLGAYTFLIRFGWTAAVLSRPFVLLGAVVLVAVLPETFLGWTPGRRLRGLMLLGANGERPGRLRLFLHAVARVVWLGGFLVLVFRGMRFALSQSGWIGKNEFVQSEAFGWLLAPATVLSVILAIATLYLTSLLTPGGTPLHDYLTGMSWYLRRLRSGATILEQSSAGATSVSGSPRLRLQTLLPVSSGSRLGDYELRAQLGQGGMGTVYDAWDTLLDRRVAIKVINASAGVNASVLARFEREARLAALLSHPNVAQVLGAGEAAGQPYMVMEFIDGENLQQLVTRNGPVPVARAWDYIRQTALALQEAARHGVIHRDIKPANLMLAANDTVKVTDFGISRILDDEVHDEGIQADAAMTGDVSLTKTGALLGTPLYISPEQARGEKLDQRSDIYSLGMTFYFLVSGKPPFEGNDIYDLISRQCQEDPRPLEGRVIDWSKGREALLRRMITKDPNARFGDYQQLLNELEDLQPRPHTLASLLPRGRAYAVIMDFMILVCLSAGLARVSYLFFARETDQAERLGQGMMFAGNFLVLSAYVIGIGRWGATPGKWFLNLRVIRRGMPQVGYRGALVRLVILYPYGFWSLLWSARICVAGAIPTAGIWWTMNAVAAWLTIALLAVSTCLIQFSTQRRGLHDLAAGTIVIKLSDERLQRGWVQRFLSVRG